MTPKPIRVAVVGKHPWKGHMGWIHPEGDGFRVIKILGTGPDMYKVTLDSGSECFAERLNLRRIPE